MRVVTPSERERGAFLNAIVRELIDEHHLSASLEYPGYVQVPAPEAGALWCFGDINPTWTGELMTAVGEIIGTVDTRIEVSDDNDPRVIAHTIALAIDNWTDEEQDPTPNDLLDEEEAAREDYEREDR